MYSPDVFIGLDQKPGEIQIGAKGLSLLDEEPGSEPSVVIVPCMLKYSVIGHTPYSNAGGLLILLEGTNK